MDKFYHTKRWKKKRESILRRDGYICQVSKRYGRMIPASTVHHVFPRDEYPELEWIDWNLISVCSRVHDELHDRNTGKLTDKGMELQRRIARKHGIAPPD